MPHRQAGEYRISTVTQIHSTARTEVPAVQGVPSRKRIRRAGRRRRKVQAMAKTKNATKVVVVTGDVTMDWNLARTRIGEGGGAAWNADHCTHAYWQRGGAALLADLIEAVGRRLHDSGQANYEVRQM